MRSSGAGTMPGQDFAGTLTRVLNEVSLPFLPELPARGVHAAGTGRAIGMLSELGADLSIGRWRLNNGSSLDQRRSRSLWAQDLDILEEHGLDSPIKIQVIGPLSLAATLERPRSGRILGDHGALRDVSESLAAGIAELAGDIRRRIGVNLTVQIDEPHITSVLSGTIPTVSGFGHHFPIDVHHADSLLRAVTGQIRHYGARAAVHCCGPDTPVNLLTGAGFTAISFDLGKSGPDDVWAQALDSGVELWPAVIPAIPDHTGISQRRDRLAAFVSALGFAVEDVHESLVVTPACGLDAVSEQDAVRALAHSQQLADSIP